SRGPSRHRLALGQGPQWRRVQRARRSARQRGHGPVQAQARRRRHDAAGLSGPAAPLFTPRLDLPVWPYGVRLARSEEAMRLSLLAVAAIVFAAWSSLAFAQFPPPGIYRCTTAAGAPFGTLSLLADGDYQFSVAADASFK